MIASERGAGTCVLHPCQEQTARVEFFDIRGISADCGQSIVGNIVSNRMGEGEDLAIVNS